jgi:succinate dehydrogenase/fumarate reductase flavoprotein subunit
MKAHLRQAMWRDLAIIRNGESIERAKASIDEISRSLPDARIEDLKDLLSFYELKGMLISSRLIQKGAGFRRESRGAHFRSDFPEKDHAGFMGSIFMEKEGRDINMHFEPVCGGAP